jgi:hypothetical protein
LLYDPPATGSSLDDFWLRGFPNPGDPYGLYTFGGNPPTNFGIRIETVCTSVPDPGSWVNILLSGIALIAGLRLKRRP